MRDDRANALLRGFIPRAIGYDCGIPFITLIAT
jgi:hypothetical protein